MQINLVAWRKAEAVGRALPFPYARGMNWVEHAAMEDATDVNKVVAAIFAAGMCSAKENKHEHYLAEYESFLSLLEARDERAREAAKETSVDAFTQIGR
jgi:hypothetical protein